MTTRAQEVMRAYEAEDTYNFPKDGVVAALRYVADRLYTDWENFNSFHLIWKLKSPMDFNTNSTKVILNFNSLRILMGALL